MILIINLDRAKERKEVLIPQLEKNGLDYFFYPAFDGSLISNPGMDLAVQPGNYMTGNKINNNEVACSLSHIGALTLAKVNNWEYAVILEDDVVICDDFNDRLVDLHKRLPKNWEHVVLSAKTYNAPGPFVTPSLLQTKSRISGTFAYMVHKSAYSKIINRLSKFDTVADDMIERFILKENGLRSFIYYPFFAYPKLETSYIRPINGASNVKHESHKHFKSML